MDSSAVLAAEPSRPEKQQPEARTGVLAPFAFAMFASAFLLFSIEPMVAKAITPLLGGTPAVWITCMLFFQILLLAGYIYVHGSFSWLGVRRQALLQLVLVLVPLLFLPIVIDDGAVRGWDQTKDPTFHVLLLLTTTVGPAFLVLSMSAPLLQGWFAALPSKTGVPRDPYVLYAASNAGSVVALAAYPCLVEPFIGLGHQFTLWHKGYIAFVLMVALSALPLFFGKKNGGATERAGEASEAPALAATPASGAGERTPWRRRLLWCGLAFVPSTYMMGLTTFVTTDVAPVPLFWVLPLLLYLVTFILVFSNRQLFSDSTLDRIVVFGLIISMCASILGGALWTILLHLTTFFFVALNCHLRLVRLRPQASELTSFYLWMSLGGALGGIFNGVVAPTCFPRAFEYPIALVLGAVCRAVYIDDRVPPERRARERVLDLIIPLAIGAFLGLILIYGQDPSAPNELSPAFIIGATVPFLLVFATRFRVTRFALGMTAILVAIGLSTGNVRTSRYVERNFFGVIRVIEEQGRHFFMHGNIVHGLQWLDPVKRKEPMAYYHRRGPLGEVFDTYGSELHSVALVGLGAGAMAAYARPEQSWTFYEINPAVVRVAEDPKLFTYLSDAFPGGKNMTVLVGDARLRIREAKDASFSLIALDAFSSDAVPVHLLTREALELYRKKLAPDGILVFNVSNRFLDLMPVMASLAHDSDLEAVTKTAVPGKELQKDGMTASSWVVMAQYAEKLAPLVKRGFRVLTAGEQDRVWTDDYSNIISAYQL